jgi:hypothetical protein
MHSWIRGSRLTISNIQDKPYISGSALVPFTFVCKNRDGRDTEQEATLLAVNQHLRQLASTLHLRYDSFVGVTFGDQSAWFHGHLVKANITPPRTW